MYNTEVARLVNSNLNCNNHRFRKAFIFASNSKKPKSVFYTLASLMPPQFDNQLNYGGTNHGV